MPLSCVDVIEQLNRIAVGVITQEEIETFEMTLGEALEGEICKSSDLVLIDGQIEWALKQYRLHSRIVPGYGSYMGNLSREVYQYLLTQRGNPQSPYYRLHRAVAVPKQTRGNFLMETLFMPTTEVAGCSIMILLAILIRGRSKETWVPECLGFFGGLGFLHGANRLLNE